MNGHHDLEQLTEQFQSLCSQVPAAFKNNSQDQRSLEKHRLAAVRAAQNTLKLLQTHDELATQQTWVPLEVVGTAIAFVKKGAKGDPLLVERTLRFLAAHSFVDQQDSGAYTANARTRDYATEERVANVWTIEIGLGDSTDPDNCAWQYGWHTKETFWQWLESHPEMSRHFNVYMTMTAARSRFDDDNLCEFYPFEKLFKDTRPEEILFVDVGGGFGQQCISLRKSFPRSSGRVILQDRPSVVANRRIPDVEVMELDMMRGQPVKDAMGPTSRLLIHEKLVADVNPSTMATKSDLLMMSVYAAMERSAGQMKHLLESVGFKVLGKYSGVGSSEWHIMEAVLG
ncbi:S-adenosyl-L-methionine-dependent methyltransferase [Diaporthe eres]|nr:S-adenosyl-L-methionine-dependent methyltransferase [Diaporthe eres]